MGEIRTRKRGSKWEYSFEGAPVDGKERPYPNPDSAQKQMLWQQARLQGPSTTAPAHSSLHQKSALPIIWITGMRIIANLI